MGFAVVINGHSLVHALHPQLDQLFLEVSSQCKFDNNNKCILAKLSSFIDRLNVYR